MRQLSALLIVVVMSASAMSAQSSQSVSSQSVPRLINVSGVFRPANGEPASAVETVTLSIYADSEGGAPLWQETQTIALDGQGRYSLLLGATQADGIPAAVFGSTGDAKWLGTVFDRAGEVEGPRVRITSVPYALRASDADTLGGRPASAYLLARGEGGTKDAQAAANEAGGVTTDVVLPGTTNFLAKYVNGADVGSSGVFEAADGAVGMGTATPFDRLHVRYNNNTGDFTGLAVQNTNGGALAYSGMLFFDHTNALTQFQGYNNATHEYRINNIARVSPGGAFNGSINFMLGGASKFFVASNGNIGIGTIAPSAPVEVSNALAGGPANMWMTSYTNFVGPYYMARRSRGTAAAPTAVQTGDLLAGFFGQGYGTTAFGLSSNGSMQVQAAQNWTDTAQATALVFTTTPINGTSPATRMTLDASGNLGIGTTSVPATGILEVSNAALTLSFAQATTTTFASSGQGSLFVGRKARGTAAAPAAVQNGDVLVGVLGRGYGATNFNGTGNGGMFVRAAETWTDTAQGTSLHFNTTTTGTTAPATRMTVDPFGNLGLGTTGPVAALDMVRESPGPLEINLTRYAGTSDSGEPNIVLRTARGTRALPSGLLAGDELGGVSVSGYGATAFGEGGAGFGAFAAENWTDTAQGTALGLFATPIGSNEGQVNLAIVPGGNVGIGVFNALPTLPDKLHVFGDIRVGTTGTTGCLKDFGGNPVAGTCSSDRRLKRDITPFDHVLDRLTALQPVRYFWRASEFPDRQFGAARAYGLIAQDVEQVLPELVVTNDDGFKAIDYSGLPLLTIQAVKDLKTENDGLKRRLAELERLVTELLANAPRR